MTIGSRVLDGRYTDSLGNKKSLGVYSSKIWKGNDSPSVVAARAARPGPPPHNWFVEKALRESYWAEFPIHRNLPRAERARNIQIMVSRLAEVRAEYRQRLTAWMQQKQAYLALRKVADAKKTVLNPYEVTIQREYATPALVKRLNPPATFSGVSCPALFGDPVGIPQIWNSNDDNALIEKLRSKLNGVSGFHAGVAMAELERTCRLFGDTAKVLRRFGQQMGRGNVAGAMRVLFNGTNSAHQSRAVQALPRASQLYLGYQFGLKPLIEDVFSAAKALGWQQGLSERPMRIRARRKNTKTARSTTNVSMSWECIERGQIVAYLTQPPNAADFMGLSDIPSILWERTWMSFVVDWFIPVGNTLAAMQMARVLKGNFVITRTTIQNRSSYATLGGNSNWAIFGDSSSKHITRVVRTVVPTLSVKMPKLKPLFHPDTAVAMKHATEAGALMVTNRKSIIKAANALQGLVRRKS